MKHNSSRSAGSALFLILIAVALLAALAYAVMRGRSAGMSSVSDDQAKLAAQDIISYGNTLAAAAQKMKLRGVLDTQFNFENSVFTRTSGDPATAVGENPNCTEDRCKIFHLNGGAVTPLYTPQGSAENTEDPGNQNALKAGAWAPHVASIDGIGTSEKDLVILSGYIKKNVCMKINEILGVPNPGGAPPVFTYGAGNQLNTGTFGAPSGTFSNGTVLNKSSYCYEIQSRPGVYNFMQTLIAR